MSERKQSIDSNEVVQRDRTSTLPSAGAPNISNFRYDGSSLTEVENDINEDDTVDTLPAPSNLEVINQTIRFAPDGTQYVTVVIEFDEVAGADGYESRIAKT